MDLAEYIRDQVIKEATRAVEKAMPLALNDFSNIAVEKIRSLFSDAVAAYYGSYFPVYYNRTSSMFGTLVDVYMDGKTAFWEYSDTVTGSERNYQYAFVIGDHGAANVNSGSVLDSFESSIGDYAEGEGSQIFGEILAKHMHDILGY